MALEAILAAVRVVAAGDALIAPSVPRRLIEHFAGRPEQVPTSPSRTLEPLTDGECEVLTLISRPQPGGVGLRVLRRAHLGERIADRVGRLGERDQRRPVTR